MNQEAITIIVAIIGSGFEALVPWVLDRIALPYDSPPLTTRIKQTTAPPRAGLFP